MTKEKLKECNELNEKINCLKEKLNHFIEFKKAYSKDCNNKIELRVNSISFGYYNDLDIEDKKIVKELNNKIDDIINDQLKKLNEDIKKLKESFKEK